MTTDNNTPSDDAFAARVASSLDRRAAGIDVQTNIDELYERAASGDGNIAGLNGRGRSLSGPMRMMLAVAAVLVVGFVGVLGVSRLAESSEEFAIQDAVSEALGAGSEGEVSLPDGEELIVWLDVGAAPEDVSAIADWLDQDSTVTHFHYVDTAETYAEFVGYFADDPEIIELVEPERLPTSFTVTTTDPAGFAADAAMLVAVQDVELASELDPDSDSPLRLLLFAAAIVIVVGLAAAYVIYSRRPTR